MDSCVEGWYNWYLLVALRSGNILDTHYDVIRPLKNFLWLHEVQNRLQNRTFSWIFNLKIGLLKSTKIKKWAAAYVCRNKNWFRHRTITPFASADSYGPKEVCQKKIWVLKSIEKFFYGSEHWPRWSLKDNFFHAFSAKFLQKLEKILLNMKKSLPPHVWVIKNGFMRFAMTPRIFLESFGLKLPRKNLVDDNQTHRTQYIHHSLRNVISKNLSKLHFLLSNPPKWPSESFEIQKIATSTRLIQ